MRTFIALALCGLLAAAALTAQTPSAANASYSQEDEFYDPFASPAQEEIEDPLEFLNRASFWVNDKVYTYILRPTLESIPEGLKTKFALTLERIGEPMRVGGVNLDFDYTDGGSEVGRLLLQELPALFAGEENSEGEHEGLQQHLGDAFHNNRLHQYYLVIPLLGPSSLEDGFERLTSFYLDRSEGSEIENQKRASMADLLQTYENVRKSALDPYIFLRESYFQKEENRKQVSSLSSEERINL